MSATETTIAAAAGHGQHAAGTPGRGDDAPSTAERLSAARAAHGEAIANHAAATERAERAAGLHRAAEAEYRNLVNAAASGSEISAADIARAKGKVSEAIDAADHSRLIAAGALALCERAAIEVMHREAEHHRAAHAAALALQIAKAEAVDRAFADLQAALNDHDTGRMDVMNAANACRMFDQACLEAARTNASLEKLESNQRPKIKLPESATINPVKIGFFAQAFGETVIVKSYSIAAALRSAAGIPAPKVGT